MKNTKFAIFRLSVVALLMGLLCSVSPPVMAQVGQATVSGTVQDASGAVIAGAAITLTDTSSRTQRTATSDSHGFFSFTALPAAAYEVKFNKADFAELRRTIVVHIADHLEIPDIRLAVSAASQSMTVTGETVMRLQKIPANSPTH